MIFRILQASTLLRDATSVGGSWLQNGTASARNTSLRSVASILSRCFSAAPDVASTELARSPELSPRWQPPPNNPKSLKPQSVLNLAAYLDLIHQARTPLEIHNAYRRRPVRLPPPIAAAKFARLAQLLRVEAANKDNHQTNQLPSAESNSSTGAATAKADGASAAPVPRAAVQQLENVPALKRVVEEIRASWDTYLHLFSADDLATCVRASCETELLLPTSLLSGASAAAVATSTSAATGGTDASAGCRTAGFCAPRLDDRSLLLRSLGILLADAGRELREAGPQAILDVSYGLMLVGYEQVTVWRTLAPLLRSAQSKLPAAVARPSEPLAAPRQLATDVLAWVERKGLAA